MTSQLYALTDLIKPRSTPQYAFEVTTFALFSDEAGLFVGNFVSAGISDASMIWIKSPLYSDELSFASGDIEIGIKSLLLTKNQFFLYFTGVADFPFSESIYTDNDDFRCFTGLYSLNLGFNCGFQAESWSVVASGSHKFFPDKDELLYDALYLNPVKLESWQKVFGFNPFEDGTLFSRKKLANDIFFLDTTFRYDFSQCIALINCSYSSPYSIRKSSRDNPVVGFYPLLMLAVGVEYNVHSFLKYSIIYQRGLISSTLYPKNLFLSSIAVLF